MSQRLHIPFQDLADYYEAGWMLYGPSDTPGFVTVAWKRTRAAVVPFACVADVMIRRDIERLQIREAALRAAEAIKADPSKSDRAIAADIGVSHPTVPIRWKQSGSRQLPRPPQGRWRRDRTRLDRRSI
jgi:hypothetical protein